MGSSDPPLRTTFLGGGQGFNAAEPAFVEPAFVEPAFIEAALVEPPPVEFVELAGLPAVVFSGVGEFEQLGGIVFL